MMKAVIPFAELPPLLRRPADDPVVLRLTEQKPDRIERSAYYASVEMKEHGLSVMLNEAPYVLPAAEIKDPQRLYVSAFHLHRQGHEGYAEYGADLPQGVRFGDDEVALTEKAGAPAETGGGGMSTVLKKRIPRWLRYPLGDANLRFEFGADGGVELVTLFVSRPGFPRGTGSSSGG
jgi:hypothetical protein